MIYVSDRVSAFDLVFAESIPRKGSILNQISAAWLQAIKKEALCERYGFSTHLITDKLEEFPRPYSQFSAWNGRAIYAKKTQPIDFECIVRGCLAGSAWKEYLKSKSICGQKMPGNLQAGEKLPKPLFSPSTKAPLGEHDRNVSYEEMEAKLGTVLSRKLKEISLALYEFAAKKMLAQGILLADTKFEFGLAKERELVLIDEVLTPDSSRYWLWDHYLPGHIPAGLDKQYIRDYVESLGWNKKPPAPPLSQEIISKTSALYQEIHSKIKQALA